MLAIRPLKYVFAYTAVAVGCISFTYTGIWAFATVLYAYALIPIVELFIKPDNKNLSQAEEELIKEDKVYDWIIYLMVPIHFALLFYYLFSMQNPELTVTDIIGRTLSMGTICGNAINIGHELGHRSKKYEQFLAKLVLLVTLMMHWFIEHNRGHHTRVATDEDPASAKKGDIIFIFWIKSMIFSYISAWKLEADRLRKRDLGFWSIKNEMIWFTFIQTLFTAIIFYMFGLSGMLYFFAVSILGMIVLETINYIEHYGLERTKRENGKYERVMPHHSWNSNHIVGRLMIFELSRHSDHHFKASRKYQILKSYDDAPQMPTGYPGMMMLSLCPPLWFYIMNPRVDAIRANYK